MAVGLALVMLAQRTYRPVPTIRRDVVGKTVRFSLGNYAAETLRELPGFVLPIIILNVFTARFEGDVAREVAMVDGREHGGRLLHRLDALPAW